MRETCDVHLETQRDRDWKKKKKNERVKRPSGMNFRSLENKQKESWEAAFRGAKGGRGRVESSSASEF